MIVTHFSATSSNGELCDVRLVVDTMKIPAHKMVLAAASPYFHSMFCNSNFKEANQDEVTIGDVNYQALQSLIEYAYTARIEITEDTVQATKTPPFTLTAIILNFSFCFIIVACSSSQFATVYRSCAVLL